MINLIPRKLLKLSLKTSIFPDDAVIDPRNHVCDYYYFKDLQVAIVLKLIAELKVSFPTYLKVFSEVTTQTSLKLLGAYPLAADMLAPPKDKLVEIIRSTARFKKKIPLTSMTPSAPLQRTPLFSDVPCPVYARICLLQTLRGIGFLSATVLIVETGSFNLFPSPKKLYAYFWLDPAVKQSAMFNGNKVRISKRGSSLAKRILHMAALYNLKVDKWTKAPVNPIIHSYYTDECKSKKKS